ncbi:MAG TPA: hypothetical protein PLI18_10320 [Pirellulaceae bacterium]|nr:hypothetical protein [Pirellulaceae bacterium]
MSIGPTNWAAGIVGSQLSSSRSSDSDRRTADAAQQAAAAETAAQARADGALHENSRLGDREGDGRQAFGDEPAAEPPQPVDEATAEEEESPPISRDATGQLGRTLDLSG